MGKSTISMAIFNSYVKLPEDISRCCWNQGVSGRFFGSWGKDQPWLRVQLWWFNIGTHGPLNSCQPADPGISPRKKLGEFYLPESHTRFSFEKRGGALIHLFISIHNSFIIINPEWLQLELILCETVDCTGRLHFYQGNMFFEPPWNFGFFQQRRAPHWHPSLPPPAYPWDAEWSILWLTALPPCLGSSVTIAKFLLGLISHWLLVGMIQADSIERCLISGWWNDDSQIFTARNFECPQESRPEIQGNLWTCWMWRFPRLQDKQFHSFSLQTHHLPSIYTEIPGVQGNIKTTTDSANTVIQLKLVG